MTIHVGFTGNREGMTQYQRETFRLIVSNLDDFIFHHGDCIGSDEQAHEIVKDVGTARCQKVVLHPPKVEDLRAFVVVDKEDEVLPPKPYIDRNHDIVEVSHFMIATPRQRNEELRSGTWSTIRYSRMNGVPCLVIPPNREGVI